jgi:cytochrome c-type protein NapC
LTWVKSCGCSDQLASSIAVADGLAIGGSGGHATRANENHWVSLLELFRRHSLVAFAAVFIAGIVFWGAFNTSIELTNTEAFCISCHEMKENVYREYIQTIHYENPTGVRATCPDCHVPRDWIHKVARKVRASNELFHWLRGSIATREKFLAKRIELAREVWQAMKETDSRECRNCHGFDFMALGEQGQVAARKHREAHEEGRTCIECHISIAHKLPEEYLDEEHDRYEREDVPCTDCHEDAAEEVPDEGWWDDVEEAGTGSGDEYGRTTAAGFVGDPVGRAQP